MSNNLGRWTKEEHKLFLEGLDLHGKKWKEVAGVVGTRDVIQVRSHAQKFLKKQPQKFVQQQLLLLATIASTILNEAIMLQETVSMRTRDDDFERQTKRQRTESTHPGAEGAEALEEDIPSIRSPVFVRFSNGIVYKGVVEKHELPHKDDEDRRLWLLVKFDDGDCVHVLPGDAHPTRKKAAASPAMTE